MYKVILRNLFLSVNSFLLSISLILGQGIEDTTADLRIDRNFDLVRSQFSGQEAFNTVSFVEKFWRIAGNDGFNSSINYVAGILEEAGYIFEETATKDNILTYRIEKRPMEELTWEPVSGSLEIIGGQKIEKILDFKTNRNMIAVNSWSTPEEGVEADLIFIDQGMSEDDIDRMDVKGKVVFADQSPGRLFSKLVREKGALGLIVYSNPNYLQPEKYRKSIQFRTIPQDTVLRSWTIVTSYSASERLKKLHDSGSVKVRVNLQTRLYQSEELTLVADIKGKKYPEERIVYSAHVQEPGANDNASGVGAQAEMARVAAGLVESGQFVPDRSITFLFGDEIVSTMRYIQEDKARARGIKWGISLDMVGENTDITGGSFLIEKMPDPSAIWTRGEDHHTEWGGSPLTKEQLKPGYFNDFVFEIFEKQGKYANWIVKTNPFEGGSDHVPFLRANIPGLLLWHFTDAFYHTDGDRIDKVSANTLQNVGTGALVAGMTLVNADSTIVNYMIDLLNRKAGTRLMKEFELSRSAISAGADKEAEKEILRTWIDYYKKSVQSIKTMIPPSDLDERTEATIRSNQKQIDQKGEKFIRRLN